MTSSSLIICKSVFITADPCYFRTVYVGLSSTNEILCFRYGSELQLLIPSPSVRENLTDIIKYTQSTILLSTSEECDWFTMLLFLIYGGNFDRCVVLYILGTVQ